MNISQKWLDEREFQLTHECRADEGIMKFHKAEGVTLSTEPCIYLWVGQSKASTDKNEGVEVLYVGKAISGPDARMRQHESGFRHSKTGQKNLRLLKDYTGAGHTVSVYARISSRITHLGHTVNAYSLEEEVIYEQLRPLWNRAKLASNRQSDVDNLENEGQAVSVCSVLSSLQELDPSGQVQSFYNEIDSHDKKRFEQLISWATDQADHLSLDPKLVSSYSGQPGGYNGVPLLIFAEFHDTGRAKSGTRKFAIPLRADEKFPLTVILNNKSEAGALATEAIENGENCFRPKSLDDFLENPSNFFLG